MKTSLDHLPEAKQRELAYVVETLRASFAAAIRKKRSDKYKGAQLLKIILFGSYARGDWVEDPVGRYFSDYDILVVVNDKVVTDGGEFWMKTEQRFLAELGEGKRLRTPVSPIYHTLDDVNEQLRLGRYFFMDIVRDGIVLFEEPEHPLAEPQPLTSSQALKETQDYYGEWFESANGFLDTGLYAASQGRLKESAF
ncbi:nucleotidyltransferase domain-containing protein [Sphingobium yanoikuyae]|uniref:nucleotidyltransferase domain-containing protein n=1 Tax=Sphingobium yanoikuyae TaxID=13690 RepID=UPI0035AFAB43